MSRRGSARESAVHGYVVVDKPAGMTSHDVVARCRRLLGQPKAGHAGTLDPDATGVLVVGLGKATRLLRFVGACSKSYVGQVVLGTATSTLDDSGEVVATFDMSGVTLAELRAVATGFVGQILQVPPMVSAVKIGGRRLHEIAREGGEVERPPRPVEVTRFDLDATAEPGVYDVTVECSSGTYVRSLADDLGVALGGGAHLRRLRRTAVGPFTVSDAVPLDELRLADVRPPEGLLAGLAASTVGEDLVEQVAHGKVLDRRDLRVTSDGPWSVFSTTGELLAVYEPWERDRAKPTVVLVSAPGPPAPVAPAPVAPGPAASVPSGPTGLSGAVDALD